MLSLTSEEQATVTKNIARHIGEATNGVRDANMRVAESSQVSQSIAKEIAGVDQSAREMVDEPREDAAPDLRICLSLVSPRLCGSVVNKSYPAQ